MLISIAVLLGEEHERDYVDIIQKALQSFCMGISPFLHVFLLLAGIKTLFSSFLSSVPLSLCVVSSVYQILCPISDLSLLFAYVSQHVT